jgi:hypothetical protein
MKLINLIKKLFKKNNEKKQSIETKENEIYSEDIKSNNPEENTIISVWDVIKCNEHTQAYHLVSVIPFDEWIDMFEIKRRIWDLFQIEYKNDRSLYPYLKTMVDLGIIETANISGKRKWRKKDLLIKIENKEKINEKIEETNKLKIKNKY